MSLGQYCLQQVPPIVGFLTETFIPEESEFLMSNLSCKALPLIFILDLIEAPCDQLSSSLYSLMPSFCSKMKHHFLLLLLLFYLGSTIGLNEHTIAATIIMWDYC